MKNIFIYSAYTNCGYRMLDAMKFYDYFLKNKYEIVDDPKKADYILLITCGVSNSIAETFFSIIKKLQEYDAELIVAGCLPAIQPEQLSQIFNGKIIVTKDLIQNPNKVDQLFPENKIKFSEIDDKNIIEFQDNKGNPLERISKKLGIYQQKNVPKLLVTMLFLVENVPLVIRRHILNNLIGRRSAILQYFSELTNQSVYCIRVSWGCKGNCSYCGIKKAVGSYLSKPLDQILIEFKKGLQAGYKEFYVSASDTGPYGLDIGSDLPELLDKLTDADGDYKIFLGGLNPIWAVKYIDKLEKIIKKGKIQSMECPIQSGSSRILKLMNRYSDVEKIINSYKLLKKSYPDMILYPHIMIGFPTETQEDIDKTLYFIKELNFNSGQIFNCSVIQGTKAAEIEPKVSHELLLRRKKYITAFLKKEGHKVIWPKEHGCFYRK